MAVSRNCNVIKSTANADSITGGARLGSVKCIAGGAGTFSLTVGGVIIYKAVFGAAGEQVDMVRIKVSPADAITVAMPASSELYLYCD